MRVLCLILIFSLSVSIKIYAKKICYGDLPPSLKNKLSEYSLQVPQHKISEILSFLGYYIIDEDSQSISIEKANVLKDIKFTGNYFVLDSSLKLAAKIYEGDYIYADTVNMVKENIETFYKNNGFLDVEVNSFLKDSVLNVYIHEGERYFVDEIDFIVDDTIISKQITPTPLNDMVIESIINDHYKTLKKEGYFNVKVLRVDLLSEQRKRFFSIKDPISSLYSFFVKSKFIKPRIILQKGDRYTLDIQIDPFYDNLTDELRRYIVSEFKSFDTFDLRELEINIKDHFIEKQLQIEDLEIKVNMNTIAIHIGKISPLVKKEPNAKKGYINNIYVNNYPYATKEKIPITPESLDKLRKEIFDKYAKDSLVKKISFEQNENDDLHFTVEYSSKYIADILSNSDEIVSKIDKRFFHDKKITNEKLQQIHDYLIRNKNSEKVSMELFDLDNQTALLLINRIRGKDNRIFGFLSYNTIDLITAEIGYSRFDILNSGRTFQLGFKKSFKETSLKSSLSGQRTFTPNIDDYQSLFFKNRDEDDYIFTEVGISTLIKVNNPIETYVGAQLSNLDVHDSSFSDSNKAIYEHKYTLLAIPVKLSYKSEYYNKLKGTGIYSYLSYNYHLANGYNFNEVELHLEGFYEFYKDWIAKIGLNTQNLIGKKEKMPVTNLLTLGGTNKMKAFKYREIGTKDHQTNATIGDKKTVYSSLFIGYTPYDNIIFGSFIEHGGFGDNFNDMKYIRDIGLELIIKAQELGFFSISYGYSPFKPYKGYSSIYLNFGISF
ncbi:MAG: BamA/TamA family outer membrane protein [Calditerrivibrio sp.]|nr:BamA/TamA family outer membrane protein [Calditerrivibrio sp.]